MLNKLYKSSKREGFTLVELLIVVAIVGILATQGIPAYQRMVQKAKKGEAKGILGTVANAEGAFYSEFGTYGSHAGAMGVQLQTAQVYTAGFPLTGGGCGPTTTVYPQPATGAGSAVGANISANSPSYYASQNSALSVAPCLTGSGCKANTNCSAVSAFTGTPPFTDYTAVATGYIQASAGCTNASGLSASNSNTSCDVWTIDQSGALKNINDGVY